MPGPVSKALAIFLATTFWVLAGAFLIHDLRKISQQKAETAEAQRLATKALATVEKPDFGWFPAERDPLFDFENGSQGWTLENDASKKPVGLEVSSEPSNEGGHALKVPVHFPDPASIYRETALPGDDHKTQGVRFVSYDVFVPKACSGYVGSLFFLKDKDGLWYQARSRAALIPGQWNTVTADIRGDSPDVIPLGHQGQWDENQASRVTAVGITLYGEREFNGEVLIDNIRGWMRPARFQNLVKSLHSDAISTERIAKLTELGKLADKFPNEPVRIINLRTEPSAAPVKSGESAALPAVKKFETLTLRFELNRQADNPFDPEKADITCKVTAPSGAVSTNIGFWYQDYDRVDSFTGDELKAIGRPEWRVRITPRETGVYSYVVTAKLQNESVSTKPADFVSVASGEKGFIHVSKQDPRYFEFENGNFFYPIGHNLHSPVDIRSWKEIFKEDPPAGRGLNMYADFFEKMQKAGENTAEVWMSSWWLGIEWTSAWRDFYGHGRYSLQNGWKLDTLLKMAREHGLNIHLVIDNHGKFSEYCDWEWDQNPYNANTEGGGCVHSAQEFFTNETARKWHRNKLRYIVARWGSDPTILGWEMVSEFDLVGGANRNDLGARNSFHRSPTLQNWAREMIDFVRENDPYKHPVTVHYASDYKFVDVALAKTPAFDYVVTDAYRPDQNYTGAAVRMEAWAKSTLTNSGSTKPFWITEYGGDWNATTPTALEADLACGPWATWMTDGAGTPMFWWYDFIDRNNFYTYAHGFANYAKGEDRRGIAGNSAVLLVNGGNNALAGYAYIWKKGAYGWIYDDAAMRQMPPANQRAHYSKVEAMIPNLDPGDYTVEYWDCVEGKIVKTEAMKIDASLTGTLHFPDFTLSVAVKIKAKTK
jgi:hypothetical protein